MDLLDQWPRRIIVDDDARGAVAEVVAVAEAGIVTEPAKTAAKEGPAAEEAADGQATALVAEAETASGIVTAALVGVGNQHSLSTQFSAAKQADEQGEPESDCFHSTAP